MIEIVSLCTMRRAADVSGEANIIHDRHSGKTTQSSTHIDPEGRQWHATVSPTDTRERMGMPASVACAIPRAPTQLEPIRLAAHFTSRASYQHDARCGLCRAVRA